MKTLSLSLLISLISLSLSSQNTEEAIEYMNKITIKVYELEDETWKYLKAVTKGKKASKVESKRADLVQGIKTAKLYVGRRKSFNGNDEFRQSMLQYLDLQYTILKEDYDKILDMEAIAEDSYDAMEAYLTAQEKAGEKLDSSFNIMKEAQTTFAEQYDITLNDQLSKRGERIEQASNTIEYYNDVFLIYFKSLKQEAYVMNALNEQDLTAMVQHNNSLKQFAEEGLNELKTMQSYRGDGTLKAEAMNVLRFYKEESEAVFPAVTDFFMKKDRFEEKRKEIESMSKKQRTQKIIDEYNQTIAEYNKASDNYNKIMQESNKERNKVLNDWERKVSHFMSNHGS